MRRARRLEQSSTKAAASSSAGTKLIEGRRCVESIVSRDARVLALAACGEGVLDGRIAFPVFRYQSGGHAGDKSGSREGSFITAVPYDVNTGIRHAKRLPS